VLLLGIEIVPVTLVGAGLIPGDAISVEPRGTPVGETVESVPMPSGEVAPMVGVGLAIPLTCAIATLKMRSAGRTVAINETLIDGLFSKLGWLLKDVLRPLFGTRHLWTVIPSSRLAGLP
jgi:hypothetical protein